jgi:hypothetical protein
MINAARTLLLNRQPENVAFGGQPGDEYLPTDYSPLQSPPAYLRNLRATLFGVDPDRVYGNYRVRQYMALLHATELVQFVTELDPRITYNVDNPDLNSDALFGIQTPNDFIHVIGELGAPDITGRSYNEWDIAVLTGSTLAVTRRTKPQQYSVQEYVFSGGLSNAMSLVGSEAKFKISDGSVQSWTVRGYARPQRDLGEILVELESTGTPYLNQLFGVGTPLAASEPFKTFRNLWFQHPELAYRLGGLLLAVIYRTEELRTNG